MTYPAYSSHGKLKSANSITGTLTYESKTSGTITTTTVKAKEVFSSTISSKPTSIPTSSSYASKFGQSKRFYEGAESNYKDWEKTQNVMYLRIAVRWMKYAKDDNYYGAKHKWKQYKKELRKEEGICTIL